MRLFKNFPLLTVAVLLSTTAVVYAQKPSPTANPQEPIRVHTESPLGCATNCLWYSGDYDSGNMNQNALYNGDTPNYGGLNSQVWVPFIPSFSSNPYFNSVQITSITFNEQTYSSPNVTSMTYTINVGVAPGFAGHTLYSGNCNFSTPQQTGRGGFGLTESAFICNLPNPVTLPAGSVYWVNVYPTISDSSPIYLSNAIDIPEINQQGWSDVLDGSYFNSGFFGYNFANADAIGVFSEFSVGMTGSYVHAYPVH